MASKKVVDTKISGSYTISLKEYEQLERRAAEEDRSMASIVRRLVQLWLESPEDYDLRNIKR